MARKTLVPPREPRIKTFSFLTHKWIETLARKNNPMRDSLRDRAKKLENKFSDLFNRGKISMLEFGIFRNFIQRERERFTTSFLHARRDSNGGIYLCLEIVLIFQRTTATEDWSFAGESGKTDSWKTRVKIGFLNGCRWINETHAWQFAWKFAGDSFLFWIKKKKHKHLFLSILVFQIRSKNLACFKSQVLFRKGEKSEKKGWERTERILEKIESYGVCLSPVEKHNGRDSFFRRVQFHAQLTTARC